MCACMHDACSCLCVCEHACLYKKLYIYVFCGIYVSVCVCNLLDELYIFTLTDVQSYHVLHHKVLLIIQVTSAMTLV